MNFLCITCEYKGTDFLVALKELGHQVFLVTSENQRHKPWPWEAIDEAFYMSESDGRVWNIDHLIRGTAYVFQSKGIDKIIALDDYDVSKAALLREEFRSPGMGQTTARHFFDKLAMRMQAQRHEIPVPGFSALFNDADIQTFLDSSEGPWLVKPRMDAGALGIRKIGSAEDFWKWSEEHQDLRHKYLIEEFKPGAVYHVDSLSDQYKVLFSRASRYLQPPFEVAHGGGIFRSQTIDVMDPETKELTQLNQKVLKAFGMNFGASHSEYIKSDRGFVFLETSARVGGAHLAEMVYFATDVNLWNEWARLESAKLSGAKYKAPKAKKSNAGIVVTLSNAEHPDYNKYAADDICWTLDKSYHVGMIVNGKSEQGIKQRLDDLTERITRDYATSVPLKE